jgi:hypothetical protein
MSIVAERVIKGTKIQGWIFTGVLLVQLVWVLVGSFFINSNMIANRQDRIGIYNKLYERISSTTQSGTVLSDDYLDMVVKSGRFIYYQPFEYGQLYQAGLWDAQDFTEALAHKNFPLVVIGGDTLEKPCCWPPPIVKALKESYQIESIPGIILLTPK